MTVIARNETIDPKDLSATARSALVDALYAAHCEIFDGVDREEFARYVVGSPANQTRIQLSYGEDGELAGYIAVHAFRRSLGGEGCTVLRAEAGLRRAYRGDGSPISFMVSQLLRMQWDYPGMHYYLGCLVHPSSYAAFARDAVALWPAPGVEIPAPLLALMVQLGDEFHLPVVDPARPLVRHVGWITRDSEAERRYWQTTDRPAPRFYIEQNPGYGMGHGLLTLVPLDTASLAKSVLRWGSARLKKRLARAMGSIERAVLRPRPGPGDAEELLVQVEEATGLDLDAVRQLGTRGTRFPIAARSLLFREGDRADAMYLVMKGSLFVLTTGGDGEEVVIDQLASGTVVGEMALMTGQPRSATVRAAVDSVLLRLTAKDLAQLLAAEPRLADDLWRRICKRVFRSHLRLVPRLAQLPHAAQEAWYGAGSSRGLAEAERMSLPAAAVVVLAVGKLLVESASGWMALSAPALAALPEGATLTALAASRVAILPADVPS